MNNVITKPKLINSLTDFLNLLNNELFETRFYLAEDLIKKNIVPSISHIYNSLLNLIVDWNTIEQKWYSIQILYIDWKKYFDIEKRNLINEKEEKIVKELLQEEFWESLMSIWVFGSYITKEDWEYSDYDLVVVLDSYEDNDIYEREKSSPKLKKRLKEAWVQSLFAFNFTTLEELGNADKNNPFLLETMWKSFYLLKDYNNKLEKIFTKERWIKYLWNFVWKWDNLNTNSNLDRIKFVLNEYRKILSIAKQWSNREFITYYEWEIKKLEIIKKVLDTQSIFIGRFDFNFVCKEILDLNDSKINELFLMYKKASIEWKKTIHGYDSIQNNINFSKALNKNNLILPSLQHRYIALRNILSKLLHKTWDFILDWEFTQRFLQIFWNNIPENIKENFYENIFKTEQILWRTWYISFDLNADWSYIFEEWSYDYEELIKNIDYLIHFFQNESNNLLKQVWEKKTKVSIISSDIDFSSHNLLFPNEFQVYDRQEVESWNISEQLENSEYIFVLDSTHNFSPDYLLKILSWFNKKWVKCVSWDRASKIRWAKNKFCNFTFKKSDYDKNWKEIFKHSIRTVWTTYFSS